MHQVAVVVVVVAERPGERASQAGAMVVVRASSSVA
jgi:hypothetical protein